MWMFMEWGAAAKCESGIRNEKKKTLFAGNISSGVMEPGLGRAQCLRIPPFYLSFLSDGNVGVQTDTVLLVQIPFWILPLNSLLVPVYLVLLPCLGNRSSRSIYCWFEGLFCHATPRHEMQRCSKPSAEHHAMPAESNLGHIWETVKQAGL